MVEVEISTKENTSIEAQVLCFKLLVCPGAFTLGELARLTELMELQGYKV